MAHTQSKLPELIPISLAAHRLNKATRGHVSPSPHTVWRWVRHGVRGVKLGAVMLNGQLFTTEDDLISFGRAVASQPAVNRRRPKLPELELPEVELLRRERLAAPRRV